MNDTKEVPNQVENIVISQSVAILIDGNNIERSIHTEANDTNTMLNFDSLIPKLLVNRGLSRLVYFREGKHISNKLQERLHNFYHGSVRPCHKSADIPLSIFAIQVAAKVDTIIIMSGDSDYIELVRHLKSEGVRVEICAVPSTTSRFIVEEVDYFHEITREDWFTLPSKKPQSRRNKKPTKPKPTSKKKSEKTSTSENTPEVSSSNPTEPSVNVVAATVDLENPETVDPNNK